MKGSCSLIISSDPLIRDKVVKLAGILDLESKLRIQNPTFEFELDRAFVRYITAKSFRTLYLR